MKGKILILFMTIAIIALILVAWSSTKMVDMPMCPSASPTPSPTPRPTYRPTVNMPEGDQPIGIIKSISFDKDTYYTGDIITAMLEVENIGGADITSEKVTINATCVRLDDFAANLYLKTLDEEGKRETYTMHFSEMIGPGQTKILSASFSTLAEMEAGGMKVNLAGDYDILVTLDIDGETMDAKELKLTLLGAQS